MPGTTRDAWRETPLAPAPTHANRPLDTTVPAQAPADEPTMRVEVRQDLLEHPRAAKSHCVSKPRGTVISVDHHSGTLADTLATSGFSVVLAASDNARLARAERRRSRSVPARRGCPVFGYGLNARSERREARAIADHDPWPCVIRG
jgi:hypothetical protein